jgi:hypothetical protein
MELRAAFELARRYLREIMPRIGTQGCYRAAPPLAGQSVLRRRARDQDHIVRSSGNGIKVKEPAGESELLSHGGRH